MSKPEWPDMEMEHVWPDVRRTCFSEDGPAEFNAVIDWVLSSPRDLYPYAMGYRDAATSLVEHAVEAGRRSDVLVFPLVNLWRHHLELALKAIIAIGRQLQGQPWGFETRHKLDRLWKDARPHIVQCGPPDGPEVGNIESVILELHNIDPGATGFRYPISEDLTSASLPKAPRRINVLKLHEAMEAVANLLYGVWCELESRLQYVIDAEHEMREG